MPRSLVVLGALVAVLFAAEILLGSVPLPVADVVRALMGSHRAPIETQRIVHSFRLPKAIVAMVAGGALATAGLQMQAIFANPLAGPFVFGVSSGAAAGVALVSLTALGFGRIGTMTAAVAGAMGVSSLMVALATRLDRITLLIVGLVFGYATWALIELLAQIGGALQLQRFLFWTFGDFGASGRRELLFLLPMTLLGAAICAAIAPSLNLLVAGEEYARSVGVAIGRIRLWAIVSVALLAGSVVAVCGPISFIGVVAPHLARALLRTADHRRLIYASIAIGASMALLADLIATVPLLPLRLPLNAVTALIGAPITITLLLRSRAARSQFD